MFNALFAVEACKKLTMLRAIVHIEQLILSYKISRLRDGI
jgi:hypothetical protein